MKNFLVKTKGNSYRNSSKESGGRKFLVWIVMALMVLVFAKDIVQMVTAPMTTMFFSARHYIYTSGATVPVFIRSRVDLLNHIRELEQTIASQKGIDATLAYVTLENEELRALMGGASTTRIVAGVIGRPPYTPYDTIVIDRGSDDGIVLHAPVFHAGGKAVGYIQSVFEHSSYIALFSSPHVEATVYIFGPDIFTTAYGEGGGIVRLSVPQGIVLEKGMPVVLPSLDSGVLGTISEIQSIKTEPEQHAYVTLSAPLQSMRLVSVGTQAIGDTSYAEAIKHVDSMEEKLFSIEIGDAQRAYSTTVATTTASTSDTHITP